MDIYKLSNFTRGWFIGNFEPSVAKQPFFEVGLLKHKKGEYWAEHLHRYCIEINLLIRGKMEINGIEIHEGEIFVINKGEHAKPYFLEDCEILCVKYPSIPGDKVSVKGMFDYDETD